MLEFKWPWAFLLLIAFPVIRFVVPRSHQNQSSLYVPEVNDFRFTQAIAFRISPQEILKLLVLMLAWLGLVTALARPQLIGEPVALPTTGRDILLAVDISQSMQIDDMFVEQRRVTRIDALKYVVEPFIESRYGDRIGLILFGSKPYTYVPLTFDIETVNLMLQDAPIGIAGGQTAIGDTIGLAVKLLIERPVDHRILVLMTDGSHNIGTLDPEQAIRLAKDANVRIHTIGLGTEEIGGDSTVTIFRRFRQRGPMMDTKTLMSIAENTGGRFFTANDTETLKEIYEEISKLEPQVQEPESLRPYRSLFHWPLLCALLLFLGLWWTRK